MHLINGETITDRSGWVTGEIKIWHWVKIEWIIIDHEVMKLLIGRFHVFNFALFDAGHDLAYHGEWFKRLKVVDDGKGGKSFLLFRSANHFDNKAVTHFFIGESFSGKLIKIKYFHPVFT